MVGYSDFSDNYQFWENTETVTVTFKRDSDAEVENVTAYRHNFTRVAELFSGVAFEGDEVGFSIPDTLLDSNEPRQQDTITDSGGTVWTITKAPQSFQFGTEWLCACRAEL